jgi:hypothetical protein
MPAAATVEPADEPEDMDESVDKSEEKDEPEDVDQSVDESEEESEPADKPEDVEEPMDKPEEKNEPADEPEDVGEPVDEPDEKDEPVGVDKPADKPEDVDELVELDKPVDEPVGEGRPRGGRRGPATDGCPNEDQEDQQAIASGGVGYWQLLAFLRMFHGREVGGFMAYDCTNTTNRVDVYSLLEAAVCPSATPHHMVEWTIFGEIVQVKIESRASAFRCRETETVTTQYCGFLSAGGVARYLKGAVACSDNREADHWWQGVYRWDNCVIYNIPGGRPNRCRIAVQESSRRRRARSWVIRWHSQCTRSLSRRSTPGSTTSAAPSPSTAGLQPR